MVTKSTNNLHLNISLFGNDICTVTTKVVALRGAIATTVVITLIFCYALPGNDTALTSIVAKTIVCNDIVFIATTVTVAENRFSCSVNF